MTKISVIVPCYNVGEYIKRCLDSVFFTNVVIKKPSISIIDNTTYWYYRHDGSLDSPILSHAKVLSRYNMVMQKTRQN